MTATDRRARLIIWLIVALLALVSAGLVSNELGDLGGDNAHYILLAKSLTQGAYLTLADPQLPPHTYSPPLFPLLLAPIIALFGVQYWMFHVVVALAGLAACWLWFQYLSDLRPPDARVLCAVLACAFSPLWSSVQQRILSDMVFVAWLCGVLLAASRCSRASARMNRWFWIALFCVLGLVFTRWIGVLVIPAILCAWADRRGVSRNPHAVRHGAWLSAAVGLALILWQCRNAWRGEGMPAFLSQIFVQDPYALEAGKVGIAALLERAVSTGSLYMQGLGWLFWHGAHWPSLTWSWLAWPALCGLMLVGAIASFRRARGPAEWWVLWYGLAMTLWSFRDGRFLLPLFPMLAWYAVQGLWMVGSWIGSVCRAPLVGRLVTTGVLSLLLIGDLFGVSLALAKRAYGLHYTPTEQEFLAAQEWLRIHSQAGDVILSRKPTVTALLTGRFAMVYPYTTDHQRVLDFIDQQHIRYVMIDNFSRETRQYLWPAVQSSPDRFEPVGTRVGGQLVLSVKRGD